MQHQSFVNPPEPTLVSAQDESEEQEAAPYELGAWRSAGKRKDEVEDEEGDQDQSVGHKAAVVSRGERGLQEVSDVLDADT